MLELLQRRDELPAFAIYHMAGPFVTTFNEMLELRNLWRREVHMDNQRLRDLLGKEPHTPLEQAIDKTLADLGCL